MFSKVCGIGLLGVEGCLVSVEADAQEGLPGFSMVGALAPEVREAQDRVRTALKNAGFRFPPRRVTVNLSPADVHKCGTGFDLPIAAAVMGAHGLFDWEKLEQAVFIGEVGLDGSVKPVRGILPMVLEARRCGKRTLCVPGENAREGEIVPDVEIVGIGNLEELSEFLREGGRTARTASEGGENRKGVRTAPEGGARRRFSPWREELFQEDYPVDYQEVQGQALMKRATEVAVAGRHNLLYIGPAGTGKTMIAQRIPTIMPGCTMEEQLEITKIYSICGLLPKDRPFMSRRPFRSPHHSVTAQALTGGGRNPVPGEMSLASGGVLFLDELPEFSRHAIEMLRQPLESHRVVLSRVSGRFEFPADFMLVAAANQCPCGRPVGQCRCNEEQKRRYLGKISKPILDRIDICTEAAPVGFGELRSSQKPEPSAAIRRRVEAVRQIQRERFAGRKIRFNSQMAPEDIRKYCGISREEERFFREFYQKNGLSARAYSKILKVARTIADLDGAASIGHAHLCEAIGYRSLEEKYRVEPGGAGGRADHRAADRADRGANGWADHRAADRANHGANDWAGSRANDRGRR